MLSTQTFDLLAPPPSRTQEPRPQPAPGAQRSQVSEHFILLWAPGTLATPIPSRAPRAPAGPRCHSWTQCPSGGHLTKCIFTEDLVHCLSTPPPLLACQLLQAGTPCTHGCVPCAYMVQIPAPPCPNCFSLAGSLPFLSLNVFHRMG